MTDSVVNLQIHRCAQQPEGFLAVPKEDFNDILIRIQILEKTQEGIKKQITDMQGNAAQPQPAIASPIRQPRYVSSVDDRGYIQLGVSSPPVL